MLVEQLVNLAMHEPRSRVDQVHNMQTLLVFGLHLMLEVLCEGGDTLQWRHELMGNGGLADLHLKGLDLHVGDLSVLGDVSERHHGTLALIVEDGLLRQLHNALELAALDLALRVKGNHF